MFWNREPSQARGHFFCNVFALAPKDNRSFAFLKPRMAFVGRAQVRRIFSRPRFAIENLERSTRQNMGRLKPAFVRPAVQRCSYFTIYTTSLVFAPPTRQPEPQLARACLPAGVN